MAALGYTWSILYNQLIEWYPAETSQYNISTDW